DRAAVARGEAALALERRRRRGRGEQVPVRGAILCAQNHGAILRRVAAGDPVAAIEEGDAIIEGGLIGVAELFGPGSATVRGVIDPRRLSLPDAQCPRLICADRMDAAEVE